MNSKELEELLQQKISPTIAEEIVRDYTNLRQANTAGKDDQVCQLAGLFFEAVTKGLINIQFGDQPSDKGIRFQTEIDRLTKVNLKTVEDEIICLLIPRMLVAGYSIRNKKRVSHARGYDPTEIDSKTLLRISDWVISELVRLSGEKPETIKRFIEPIATKHIPIIETIGEEHVLLDHTLSCPKATLTSMYHLGGEVQKDKLKNLLTKNNYADTNVTTTIRRLKSKKSVFEKEDTFILTSKGIAEAEKILSG